MLHLGGGGTTTDWSVLSTGQVVFIYSINSTLLEVVIRHNDGAFGAALNLL